MTQDLLPRLQAALQDRYRIERPLGAGGMATVYLAEDLKHHRQVAIKVLRPELTAALGPERFLREIEISAKLNHPHILPLLDSGEAEGFLFYVMPYVEGESLRHRLEREKQLALSDAVQVTREVADALSYAHHHDVIHRDIKPGNILLESGHAVVSDFGIARAITAAGGDRPTGTGIAVGTPAYMSPEQASGDKDVDPRSDVYSLGCTLYEMLSGETPYTARTPQVLIAKKLSEPLPRVSVVRETVPKAVEAVLLRALARVPADRFPTAFDFAEALAQAASGEPVGTSVARVRLDRIRVRFVASLIALFIIGFVVVALLVAPRIGGVRHDGANAASGSSPAVEDTASLRVAVLPAEVQAGIEQAFSRGPLIQHLLASELTRYRGLAVVDPLSLNTRLEGAATPTGVDPLVELQGWGLEYVVRTTVVPTTGGFELTLTLTDARRAAMVATDAFTITDDAELPAQIQRTADQLVDALEAATGGITKIMDLEPWLSARPTDVAAVEAFLQGTEYAYRDMPGGREHFERAVGRDPDFIAPRVWLVSGLVRRGDTAAAREHVEVLQSLASGATPFERAMISWADAVFRGDLEAKVRHLRVALGYSPRNNILLYNLGATLELMGQLEEAVDPIRDAVESRWRFPPLYTLWGVLAIETGELDGLRETLQGGWSVTPRDPYLAGLLEALALFEGDVDTARGYGASFRAGFGDEIAGALSEMVTVYRSLANHARARGKAQTALLLLRRAVDAEPGLPAPRLELARALAEAGDRGTAESHYRSIKSEQINTPDVLFLMGEVAAILRLQEDAQHYLTQYLEVAPEGPEAMRARELLGLRLGSSSRD